MRKKVIAGNWKMNMNLNESVSLISDFKKIYSPIENTDIIVCPPFTSLETINALIRDNQISLGAQNMYFENSGAFTGEISASMLKSVGCQYVIIGHSERRTIFGETNETINKKIKVALEAGLIPIFCIGETLEERENNITFEIIENQLSIGLMDIDENAMKNIIVAYEPVWAIGTGKTASPGQAQEVHNFIRNWIKTNYSDDTAQSVIIQYGGSVKPENAKELLNKPDIDGALVGGACLNPDSFNKIIQAAVNIDK